MSLNAEDQGHRRFILVQLPEKCEEGSVPYTEGYRTICDIGEERIRRSGEKVKAELGITAQDLDVGFRVFRLDDSNMNDVYYSAGEYTQNLLSMLESNVKEDRTDIDLLLVAYWIGVFLSHCPINLKTSMVVPFTHIMTATSLHASIIISRTQ